MSEKRARHEHHNISDRQRFCMWHPSSAGAQAYVYIDNVGVLAFGEEAIVEELDQAMRTFEHCGLPTVQGRCAQTAPRPWEHRWIPGGGAPPLCPRGSGEFANVSGRSSQGEPAGTLVGDLGWARDLCGWTGEPFQLLAHSQCLHPVELRRMKCREQQRPRR